jgi:hypothetical protein
MFQVDPRMQASIRAMIIVLVCAGWVAYGVLGGGQVFLAVMLVLSIVLVGGAFALVGKRTPGEPVRR